MATVRHTGASIESGKRAKPGAKLSRAAPAELRRLRACAAVQDSRTRTCAGSAKSWASPTSARTPRFAALLKKLGLRGG